MKWASVLCGILYVLYPVSRESLKNPARPRDNSPVITDMHWVDRSMNLGFGDYKQTTAKSASGVGDSAALVNMLPMLPLHLNPENTDYYAGRPQSPA